MLKTIRTGDFQNPTINKAHIREVGDNSVGIPASYYEVPIPDCSHDLEMLQELENQLRSLYEPYFDTGCDIWYQGDDDNVGYMLSKYTDAKRIVVFNPKLD